jgi:hypothetical protein
MAGIRPIVLVAIPQQRVLARITDQQPADMRLQQVV